METDMMRRWGTLLIMVWLCCACSREEQLFPIVREEGSGTRAAFGEVFGISEEELSLDAIVTNSTSVVKSCVAGNPDAIGYLSFGALDDSIRALAIDGVLPSRQTLADGSYPVTRTFYLAAADPPDPDAAAFLSWLSGDTARRVTSEAGYLPLDSGLAADAGQVSRLVLSGSSSVAPLIDLLRLAYLREYPDARIEVQQSDSSSGAAALSAGICQLAMLSRPPAEGEMGRAYPLALDALALIVHPRCPLEGLSGRAVQEIFSGRAVSWDDVQ